MPLAQPIGGSSSSIAGTPPAAESERGDAPRPAAGDHFLRRAGSRGAEAQPIRRLDGSVCFLPPHEARALAELPDAPYGLPPLIPLGASTIHRYREGNIDVTISAFVPVAGGDVHGELLDLNAKRFDEIIPDRCILSDFGRRPCIGVDKRPGTPLDRWLRRFVACMPRGRDGYELETVLEYLRTRLSDVLDPRPERADDEDRARFPWDQNMELPIEAEEAFRAASGRGVDDPPLATGVDMAVVPFERFLEAGRGACLQKALLATLILERLGFPCRLVNGAVDHGLAQSGGHTWVALPDGRILCPTWQLCEQPRRPDALPGELEVGISLLFENQRSPYLRLL